eukprot:XP_011531523.1 uncharacterized protein LOC105374378 isoform X6 [Homo sapiens]
MRGSKSLVCKRAGPPDGHIRRNDPQRGSPTGWEIRPAGRSATQPRQGQTDDKTETQKMNQLGSVHRASVWKSQNPDPDPNCSVPALTPNQPVPLSLVLFHPAFLSKNLIGRCGDGATTEEKVVKRASCLSDSTPTEGEGDEEICQEGASRQYLMKEEMDPARRIRECQKIWKLPP